MSDNNFLRIGAVNYDVSNERNALGALVDDENSLVISDDLIESAKKVKGVKIYTCDFLVNDWYIVPNGIVKLLIEEGVLHEIN